ncbi:hypothetical protein GF340_00120 [Candidatus Peregrinibacteria bacterium]|nr:hypothetical protein [Candidatus Peregrinibacteria bacterium]
MDIIPALYILDGKIVSTYKGDFNQVEVYSKSPKNFAKKFASQGAIKIYIEDLNAYRDGAPVQLDLIKKIIQETGLESWVVAGAKQSSHIQEIINSGASKVVLRSPTLEFAKEAIAKYGNEKIVVLIFAKRSELLEEREKRHPDDITEVIDYAEDLVPLGVKTIIFKDRSSEGVMVHPDYDEIEKLNFIVGEHVDIYSASGISEQRHLDTLSEIGAKGAIIGKAFYENALQLSDLN